MNIIKVISLLLFIGIIGFLSGCEFNEPENDMYPAITADGLELKLKRYRPDEDAPYRENKQPVLLMPGLGGNINEFLCHTPAEKKKDYAGLKLPRNAASWALGDSYVARDPMRYYSIAHYLWVKGYDVWLGNFRGVGRDEFHSENGEKNTNLDTWSLLDAPALIDTVRNVTGIDPVIGGHSTGGLVSYLYLTGAHFDMDEYKSAAGDYIPHVKFDPDLAVFRNAHVKGLIGLDPAGIPPFCFYGLIDSKLVWNVLDTPVYLPFDSLVSTLLGDRRLRSIPYLTADLLFGVIAALDNVIPLPPQYDLFGVLRMWNVSNTNKYVEDFFLRYGSGSLYLGCMNQYADWGINERVREFYKNGSRENNDRIVPPKPGTWDDDLTVYQDAMDQINVPMICIFSEESSLVDTQTMVTILVDAKTHHSHDEWYVLPGSAHIDVPVAENAPTFAYPKIGTWLEKIGH